MALRQITERKIIGVLLGGFTLVILLLMAASSVAIVNVQSIRGSAGALVREQGFSTRLIDEILHEQLVLSAVFHRLSRDPESVDRERVVRQLDSAGSAIRGIVALAAGAPDERLWRDLEKAAAGFSSEARRFLDAQLRRTPSSRELVRSHEAVLAIVAKLIAAGQQRATAAQETIDRKSRELVQESFALLGACLLLAVVSAVLTVRMTTGLFRQMEWQAGELSRVSWHMLDRQESAARRFSHELHDELGQSLTAVKANLVTLDGPAGTARDRQEDCLRLVDEAIHNVRELSQLLRPTILDDFGLDAGIRWLAEGFTRRTGIHIDYHSNLASRLPEEVETHLFRIAQEALTNVARHSGAGKVVIRLVPAGDSVRLTIGDDGRGLKAEPDAESAGLGIIGMRARARSAGGECSIGRSPEGGVEVEARVPARRQSRAAEDPHPVGR